MIIGSLLSELDLPYSEYWLPLLIGMGAGFMSLLVARVFTMKQTVPPPLPKPKATQEEYDPFVHGSPSDQRRAFRRNGNPVGVHYALSHKKNTALIGWVFDRSVGGVGMVTSDAWAEGVVLEIRPLNAPDIIPWVEVE